ncbi:unnamed protein product, partial [Acanthoscelides obtectus]
FCLCSSKSGGVKESESESSDSLSFSSTATTRRRRIKRLRKQCNIYLRDKRKYYKVSLQKLEWADNN